LPHAVVVLQPMCDQSVHSTGSVPIGATLTNLSTLHTRRLQVRRSSGRTPAGSLEYCTPLVPRAPGPRPAQTQYAEVSRLVYAGERSGARTKSKVAKSGCAAAVPCAMSDERWMGTASRLRGRDAIARADAGPRATRAIAARSPVVDHGHERR